MKILYTTIAALGATLMLAAPAAAKTWAECDYEAKVYAVNNTNVGGATVGSAIAGGLIGLGISSITGNVNTAGNIAAGAAIGGVGGYLASNAKQKALYDSYMASCWGQPPQPQPIYAPVPQPGSVFPPPGPQAVVYQSLNVRVCPQASGACPPIGSIPAGSAVPVNSCTTPNYVLNSGWCQVGIPAGWGWASKSYLNF
jgi:hypothetical protein